MTVLASFQTPARTHQGLRRLLPLVIAWGSCLAALPAAFAQDAPIGVATASAGEPSVSPASPAFAIAPVWFGDPPRAAGGRAPERACEACPRRRPVFAAFEVFAINVGYNLVNRLRPPEEREQFQVSLSSWWDNLKYGFEWDDNAFGVNQFGHPYQGSMYFNAARSNGLSFWESAPYAAFGSAMWEYFGETHPASMNDFINTTVGGMAIGEMLYRAGWLVRNTTETGGARTKSEILALLLDPITGLNRFMSGETKRVYEKPADLAPGRTFSDFEAGALWRGDNTKAVDAVGEPYVQIDVGYGDMLGGPHRKPFDAFSAALRLGGGSTISEANIRGRLYGRTFGGSDTHTHSFMVIQAYDFTRNNVYEFGGQTIAPVVAGRYRTSDRSDVVALGGGGALLLGAFSSPYVYGADRDYDYGPGLWGMASAALRVDGRPVLKVAYNLIYMHVVSGTSGDHVAQSMGLDALVPLRKQLRLGVAGEYIRRKIYYDFEDDVNSRYPQFRVYLAWVNK